MMPFYIVLLFVGVLMTFFQLIYLTAGKRSLSKSMKVLEEKQDELEKVLNDADLMVDELNKISDYIIQQVDVKSVEVERVIALAEDRIRYLEGIRQMQEVSMEVKKTINNNISANSNGTDGVIFVKTKHNNTHNEKVISFGAKHSQVLNLANDGLNDADIARNLNIGKGEIELIRGMNRVGKAKNNTTLN